MKVASGLFGIFASILAVAGLFCGGGASCLGAMGLNVSPTSERFSQGVGAQIGCLIFLIPIAALSSLIGGIVSFARPRVGGMIQLYACGAILAAYGIAAVYAGKQAGAEGVTASIMTFLFGGLVPAILSGLGAIFGLRAESQSTTSEP